jgi:hypothetical protein
LTDPRGLLLTASGEPFATGAANFLDAHPDVRDPLPRIYVEILPEGAETSFLALLDTGGHYCILNRSVAEEIEDRLALKIGMAELQTAYGLMRGELYLHRITLLAEQGEPLAFEATVFVSSDWQGPCFLGYTGALDRICLATHPGDNRIYFGSLT